MTPLLLITGKTCFLFLLTLFCFRLMGYRTVGDMEPLDYVIVLGIGEIMGSPISNSRDSVLLAAAAIVTLTLLQISLSALYAKVPRLGRMMEGKPIPVIENGRLLRENLRRNRVDEASIREELRIKGVRDEKDVDRAFLEPSGRFSVILKNEASPITPRYLNREASVILAENGEIRAENWDRAPFTRGEVISFLQREKIRNFREVDTLLWKDGNFLLERKPPEQNRENGEKSGDSGKNGKK